MWQKKLAGKRMAGFPLYFRETMQNVYTYFQTNSNEAYRAL